MKSQKAGRIATEKESNRHGICKTDSKPVRSITNRKQSTENKLGDADCRKRG
ncbi:MAG: hypothetical protein IJ936_07810 [Peptococcaceae bacterium]|nr:hypothetical protein [Peptococcaceae bacterium]